MQSQSILFESDVEAPSPAPAVSSWWRKAALVGGGLALFAAGCLVSAASLKPMNPFRVTQLRYEDYQGPTVPAYSLPPLPYAAGSLEPYIDEETMQIHHDKHHQAYVNNLNQAVSGTKPAILQLQADAIKASAVIRNNGGGVYNHDFFWRVLSPEAGAGTPSPKLLAAINDKFGSLEGFQAKFEAAGLARFGSGWVWLVVDCNQQLVITSTPNQDNPLMKGVDATEGIPILALDVWEHAYYLKYRNLRASYQKAFWHVVNWNQVNVWYDEALNGIAPSF